MAEKRNKIVLRFGIVYAIMIVLFLLVIVKIFQIQFVEGDKWIEAGSRNFKHNIPVKANRGNIYSSDGRLLASTIPSYHIMMDTRVEALQKNKGELFYQNVDSLAIALSDYFGDRTKEQYKQMIVRGYKQKTGNLRIYPHRITYSQLKDVQKMPLFRLGRNRSGLIYNEYINRVKPFGSLASRTIGDVYLHEEKGAKNGLELYFDDQLTGKPGIASRVKVANRWQENVQVEPTDGLDIVSTLDVEIQDIAEKILVDSLKAFGAQEGYVIVMEVATGQIKAISNMYRLQSGEFAELKNGAVSDMAEPGSTFKVAAFMALIDEGKAKPTDTINTGKGQYFFHNRPMNDHNRHKGGYGTITLSEAIHASSNIGISKAVVKAYGKDPGKFIDKLYKMKLTEPLNIEIPGAAVARIKHPKTSKSWSAISLPWISIGYETQIPPIYTVTFFNAIANNGKMMKPYLAKEIQRNGQVVKTFEPVVMSESICKASTLKIVQESLLGVVEGKLGTAQVAKSNYVRIAGKTGTAIMSKGRAGYKAGGKNYQVAFAGYFPADDPLYSCVVIIREPKGTPSGGKMSGTVFRDIAERVMAMKTNANVVTLPVDSMQQYSMIPKIKNGNARNTSTILNMLNIAHSNSDAGWVKLHSSTTTASATPLRIIANQVPDVRGMGARDAIYLLSELGLRVQIAGRGKVVTQSFEPGSKLQKGTTIILSLQ